MITQMRIDELRKQFQQISGLDYRPDRLLVLELLDEVEHLRDAYATKIRLYCEQRDRADRLQARLSAHEAKGQE